MCYLLVDQVLFFQSYIRDKGSEHRQVLEVVEMMLEYMPTDRMKLKDAMKHPFFRAVKKQHPNRYPEYTPTPDRESRSKSRRSSRMDEIKERPVAEEEEKDKGDSACAVQCDKGELVADLSIDEADDVRREHILKDEEVRTRLDKEREPLQKGINLPALEEEKSRSEPKVSLKPPRKYDGTEKDKPRSEESRQMDVFDTEMNLLNMKLKHLREEFQMAEPKKKEAKNEDGAPPSKDVEDVPVNKEEGNQEEESEEGNKKYKKMSDAAMVEMNMTPSQLVRQWLQTPSTKSDKSPQGSISPAPVRKEMGNAKSSSSPTSSKGDGEAANNGEDSTAERRRRRRHRQEAHVVDSFDQEEPVVGAATDLDARLEARRAARQKKISQDNSQASSIDDSETSSTTGDQTRDQRAAVRRLRRNKVVEPDPPPEPKKQEISMRSIFDFFNNKASPDVLKVYPDLFTDKNVKSDSVPNDSSNNKVSSDDTCSVKPRCKSASIEPSDRTDDVVETEEFVEADSRDDPELNDQNGEEDSTFVVLNSEDAEETLEQSQEERPEIVDDGPSDQSVSNGPSDCQQSTSKELTNSQDSDSSGIQDNYSTAEEDPSSPAITKDSVSACASFMCVPTQSIKFPGEIQTEEATNS